MSEENVELVRLAAEAYSAGYRDAYVDFMAEDVDIHPDASRFPEAKPFCGREEFRQFIANIDQEWEGGATAEIGQILSVGDRVLVRSEWGGTGRASGIDLRSSLTVIYTVRDGRIIKLEYFFDHAQALEAAGLSE